MYVKVKQFTEKYPWCVPVILIIVCFLCVWFYTNRSSNIDTTGISRSIELNQRTENAIDRSTELTAEARADAERAKVIIGESRNILERAKERNTQSQDGATQK